MTSTLTAPPQSFAQDLWIASGTPVHKLGERAQTNDGRCYRYCSVEPSATTVTGQVAGASLVAGNVIQAAAVVTTHLALTPTVTSAIGATTLAATLGGTAAYVNQYADGYVEVDTSPGNGMIYNIASHALVAASGVITVNLPPSDTIQVAVTATSRVGFHYNLYKAVIQGPVTTLTNVAVGVAHWALPSLTVGGATGQNFGWIQTRGPASVLMNGTPALGAGVAWTAATAAGSVSIASSTFQVVGYTLQVGVSGKNNLVYLTID